MQSAESWAQRSDVQQVLAKMLADPWADHQDDVRALLDGELRTAHAVGLWRASNSKQLKQREGLWRGAHAGGSAFAYHVWLYHFLGGAETKLPAPAVDDPGREFTRVLHSEAKTNDAAYAKERSRLQKALARGVAAGRTCEEERAVLNAYRLRLYDAQRLRRQSQHTMQAGSQAVKWQWRRRRRRRRRRR